MKLARDFHLIRFKLMVLQLSYLRERALQALQNRNWAMVFRLT